MLWLERGLSSCHSGSIMPTKGEVCHRVCAGIKPCWRTKKKWELGHWWTTTVKCMNDAYGPVGSSELPLIERLRDAAMIACLPTKPADVEDDLLCNGSRTRCRHLFHAARSQPSEAMRNRQKTWNLINIWVRSIQLVPFISAKRSGQSRPNSIIYCIPFLIQLYIV